jgi:sulfide:quinone oxidoreductase
MGQFRKLAEDFWVAPQLRPADFAAARALGVRTVINNRPDGEAADQLDDAEAAAAAAAAGLAYVHVPVPTGGMSPDHIRAFRAAVDAHEGPFLAYCRSGTRSCYLWAFAAVRELPVDYVIAAAAEAGYDLEPARGPLASRPA